MKSLNQIIKERKEKHYMRWIIFNWLEEYEFAVCDKCGREEEPKIAYPWGYPDQCPGCGRICAGNKLAENT